MKTIKLIFIIIFCVVLVLPLCFFNFKENVMSTEDNRMLEENPFSQISSVSDLADLGQNLKEYANDRIGFRSAAIAAHGYINDKLFGIMSHPYYMKGQDGHIFLKKWSNVTFSEFHQNFAEMIVEIDKYCKERSVPFLFVFSPEKLSIMRDKAPLGMNYDNSWVDEFLGILEKNGVNYVNNTVILTEKYKNGEAVFNKQYDVNHWNDLGAFYGTNCIIEKMQVDFPQMRLNTLDDFNISQKLNVNLQQSGVLVEEYAPLYTPKTKVKNIGEYKDEVTLNKNYNHFGYRINENAHSPKTLVFQGSYMNTRGYKFLANALSEYIAIHDYQNVLNFEYYYDLFEPEYVIFEVAEYTFRDMYFDSNGLKNFELSPVVEDFKDWKTVEHSIDELDVVINKGSYITNISVSADKTFDWGYIEINGRSYSLLKGDGNYTVSLMNDKAQNQKSFIFIDNQTKIKYVYQ